MIPTSDNVQQRWNFSAPTYAKMTEESNLQLGLSLARMLSVSSAANILEAGCGSGMLTLELLMSLPSGVNYTSIDISDEMINIANKRKEAIAPKLNDINHTFIRADVEDLSAIPDESIDVYLSPLCLHITPNPSKALKEAMRVLKKGGRLGFSVLGSYEESTLFKIFKDREKEFNIKPSDMRSIFYLGSREAMIKLAEENNVKIDFCWVEYISQAILDESDVDKLANMYSNAIMISQLDKENGTKLVESVKKIFMDMKKAFTPVKTENVLLVGRKSE